MHQFSLVHGQLSAANILVGVEQDDSRVQIAAVQHICAKTPDRPQDLVAELAQLEASLAGVPEIRAAHRVRFLRACFGSRFGLPRRGASGERSGRVEADGNGQAALGPHVAAAGRAAGESARSETRTEIAAPARRWRERHLLGGDGGAVAVSLPAARPSIGRCALPVRYSVPGDQLLVLSDFKLHKDHELIRELNESARASDRRSWICRSSAIRSSSISSTTKPNIAAT